MNYLEEIVLFHRWKEVNPLPASAIALWYELMAICNKAGWPEEFTFRNVVLQSNAGLSRKEFDRGRQLLIENGLIMYKKSHRVNQAGKYKIISRTFKKDNSRGNEKDNSRGNEKDNSRGNFIKELKVKDTTTTHEDHSDLTVNDVYTKVFGQFFMTPLMSDYVQQLIDSGKSEAFVKELMLEVGQSGTKPSLRYMQTICDRWIQEGIVSREEAKSKNPKHFAKPVVNSQSEKVRKMREAARRLQDEEARNV